MATVLRFTVNPFQENTFVVYDETGECVIVDPGCSNSREQEALRDAITRNNLTPVRLLNTHCHVDHVFGNRFVADTWNLSLEIHRGEVPVLKAAAEFAAAFGLSMETSPEPGAFLEDGDVVRFGNTELAVRFTPGHSPASISFYCAGSAFLLGGDVLFLDSIGRTDLPGGDMATLMASIEREVLSLDDAVVVHPGHGPDTTVGRERRENPFMRAHLRGERF